jgi:hypothetical protein
MLEIKILEDDVSINQARYKFCTVDEKGVLGKVFEYDLGVIDHKYIK